jgi:hypothetical protein
VERQRELPISIRPARRPPRGLAVAAFGLLAVGLLFAWWWDATAEGRALRALPDAERTALYRHTVETLRQVCEPAPPRSLRSLCQDSAHRVLEFRECDGDCREIARRMLSLPMR